MLFKLATLTLIIVGESLSIYSQVQTAALPVKDRRWFHTSRGLLLLWAVAGLFLISGYSFGVKAFGGVWPVTAVSVTSILIVEPLLLLALISHKPSRNEMGGFICGAIGLLITLVG